MKDSTIIFLLMTTPFSKTSSDVKLLLLNYLEITERKTFIFCPRSKQIGTKCLNKKNLILKKHLR